MSNEGAWTSQRRLVALFATVGVAAFGAISLAFHLSLVRNEAVDVILSDRMPKVLGGDIGISLSDNLRPQSRWTWGHGVVRRVLAEDGAVVGGRHFTRAQWVPRLNTNATGVVVDSVETEYHPGSIGSFFVKIKVHCTSGETEPKQAIGRGSASKSAREEYSGLALGVRYLQQLADTATDDAYAAGLIRRATIRAFDEALGQLGGCTPPPIP